MVVLPKGTLVHFRGMPFRLLADAETEGLQSNYDLAATSDCHVEGNKHIAAIKSGLQASFPRIPQTLQASDQMQMKPEDSHAFPQARCGER